MGHRPLILVVDDDPAIRRLVRVALEGDGYAVATVATGEAALAWLAETRPDLVVLDVTMPKPNGWDVLRRLSGKDWPGGRIPVVARLDRTIDRAKAYRHGADHYLLTPFAPDDLLRRVEAIVPCPAETAHSRDGDCRLRPGAEAVPADEADAAQTAGGREDCALRSALARLYDTLDGRANHGVGPANRDARRAHGGNEFHGPR